MIVIPNGIIEEIRAELARQKRTLRDLSKASGVSYDSVLRKVNQQTRALSLDEFLSFSNALNLPASELLARAEAALAASKTKGGENK